MNASVVSRVYDYGGGLLGKEGPMECEWEPGTFVAHSSKPLSNVLCVAGNYIRR